MHADVQPAEGAVLNGREPIAEKPLPLTDLGNAERLVKQHGVDLRYCPAWGRFLIWDGRRFRVDDMGMVMLMAKQTARSIYMEAAAATTKEEAAALAAHARRSEARSRLEAMLFLAQSEPGIAVSPDALDADPWLLNMNNGTIDLAHGCVLRPHQREDMITKLAPVDYDSSASCPTWLAFLDRVLGGKQSLIDFLQRAIGYVLTGSTRERVIFILFGTGRNGKSTLLDVLGLLLGEYGETTPTETLLAKRDTGIPNDLARLKGARFVSTVETDEGARLAEAKLKALSGRDAIAARFMRSEWFTFMPEFKVWLGTNHKPIIRGTDAAIWDRIRLVPFEVRISDEEEDKDIRSKLKAELPGILAWAVQGNLAWQRDGLGMPSEVRAATNQYRAEMDTLADFFEDRCVIGSGLTAKASDLFDRYKSWCERSGEKHLPQRVFGLQLQERGFTPRREGKDRTRIWLGVGLRDGQSQAAMADDSADASGGRPQADATSDITGASEPYEGLYGNKRPLASATDLRPPPDGCCPVCRKTLMGDLEMSWGKCSTCRRAA